MEHPPSRLLEGPIALSAKFVFMYPKSFSKKKKQGLVAKPTKPDIDNLLKPLKDSMKEIIYHDDAQIVKYEEVGKYYDPQSYIQIIVKEIN